MPFLPAAFIAAMCGVLTCAAATGRPPRPPIASASRFNTALPWMTEAVKCVADRHAFYAASLRTTTVESTLNWPILVRPPG